jgi:uncharacterized membrane protein YkvA (DUF1232 family)
MQRLRQWAHAIRRDVHAVYLAGRDPRVAWYVKILALLTAAYALSPIDFIPDFVPVLGYLDDLILVPLALLLVIRLIPAPLMAELRAAAEKAESVPVSRAGAAMIIALWIIVAAALIWALWPHRAA